MIRVARLGIVAGVVAATACTGNLFGVEDFVSVTVHEPELAVRSERVVILSGTIHILNGSPRPVGVTFCGAGFQRRDPDGWSIATAVICTGRRTRIWVDPGDGYSLEEFLASPRITRFMGRPLAGEYRFVVQIVDMDLKVHWVTSEPFTLEPVPFVRDPNGL